MSKNKFYKELYRFLDKEDVGVWGWVNLDDQRYKDFQIELNGGKRSDTDKSYSHEEKELYPYRLKVRLKRLLFSFYKAATKELGWTPDRAKRHTERLGTICDVLIAAYAKAAHGDRSGAVDILYKKIFADIQISNFRNVLDENNEEIRRAKKRTKLSEKDALNSVCLYRMRSTAKYETFGEGEMFHIPFDLVHKTCNERYSICGLPSLYLSSSVYDCWMELNCPRIETANVALFKPNLDVSFLDLTYPKEDEEYDESKISLLPIIVACDMPVKYEEDNYKYEYTIPQLILECLVKYRDNHMENVPLGIRYMSVKRKTTNFAFSYKEYKRLYYNYVFPPVNYDVSGQCNILTKSFECKGITTAFNMQNIDRVLPVQKLFNDHYENSLFYRLEQHLINKGVLFCSSRVGALTYPK